MKTEWVHKKLGDDDVAKIIMGQSPSSASYNDENIGLPFLQGCADFGEVFPKTSVYCNEPLKVAPQNSILMSVRAPVGTINKADQKYIIGRGLCSIVSLINNDYLYYYLLQNKNRLEQKAQGSTFLAINSAEVNDFDVSYPADLSTQRRIAAILASADKVIAATQKTIAKYKQIKQGMMENLLKPKDGWKMVKLGEVGEIVTGSTPTTTKAEYWDGEYNFYSPADFDDRVYCGKTERTVTKAGMDTGRRIPENSIMVACIASIGKLSINRTEGITNQQINTIVPKTGYDYIFLYYLLLFNVEKIKGGAAQTTIPIINKEDFSNLEFSVPDFSEQKRMASILNGIDSKIEVEQRVLNKYIQVKKGLMEKLLND